MQSIDQRGVCEMCGLPSFNRIHFHEAPWLRRMKNEIVIEKFVFLIFKT